MSAGSGPSKEVRQIGGALSRFWEGGSGPTAQATTAAISIAGAVIADGSNKQQRVLNTILNTDDADAREVIEALLSLLREDDYFTRADYLDITKKLANVIATTPHSVTPDFRIDWSTPPVAPGLPPGSSSTSALGSSAPPSSAARVASTQSATSPLPTAALASSASSVTASSPDLDLLCSCLKRLSMGAIRPLVDRRLTRAGILILDEYDMQDLVETLLKSMFNDVRREEPTATAADSFSKMDFFIPKLDLGIEVKVSRADGDTKKLKLELTQDIIDFQTHAHVKRMVAVVYDLDNTMSNPEGFETGLSGDYKGMAVTVLVAPWVGPRQPPSNVKDPGVK